jgi:hypothetical protein
MLNSRIGLAIPGLSSAPAFSVHPSNFVFSFSEINIPLPFRLDKSFTCKIGSCVALSRCFEFSSLVPFSPSFK